jgi:hypothetical protein
MQFSAPYAHHILGKAERPWRTIWDNACAMMHSMSVPNAMWSCAVSTIVDLRNRTFSRAVGPSGGVHLTLLTQVEPDASEFRVFGCTVFAKVPDKLRRKLGEKAFRGVMVGYPSDALGNRVYNPVTRSITTSVHVTFHEIVPGFLPSLDTNPLISDDTETVIGSALFPSSHAVSHDLVENDDGPPLPDDNRPSAFAHTLSGLVNTLLIFRPTHRSTSLRAVTQVKVLREGTSSNSPTWLSQLLPLLTNMLAPLLPSSPHGIASNLPRTVPLSPVICPLNGVWPFNMSVTPSCPTARGNSLTFRKVVQS